MNNMRNFICSILHIPTITPREGAEALNTLAGYCIQRGMKEGDYSTSELLNKMKPYIDGLRFSIPILKEKK